MSQNLPSNLNIAQRTATQVLLDYWDSYLPVNVTGISRKLGCKLIFTEDMDQELAGCYSRSAGEPQIWINSNMPASRQRLAVAYGLGHAVMGHDQASDSVKTLFEGGLADNLSLEAKAFAMQLLMPKPVLDDYITNNHIQSINDLAKTFGVGGTVMLDRLRQTGWQ